jgi:ABC-type Fe3+ transport system substrate-binding protein
MPNRDGYRKMIATALATTGLLMVSLGSPFAAEFSPAMKQLIAAANKEGKLAVSYGTSTFGGAKGAQMIERAMNKMFGTKIDIRYTPGAAMARIGNQLITEFKAKQPAFTDVYVGAAAQQVALIKRKVLLPVDWKALLPDRILAVAVEQGGVAIRIGTGMSGVTYNSELAPYKPTKLSDFLDPRWKGKIASTPYAASFDSISSNDMWGPKKIINFVEKLSDNIAGLMRCGEMERIASGEFIALVMDCTGQSALVWKAKGAPIDQMIPLDAAQARYYYLSVPKNSARPAAAKLFIAFLHTVEGQKIIWDTWKIDLHLYPESRMSKLMKSLKAQGVNPREVTIAWWMSHPEISKTKRQLVKILRKKKKKKK